MTTASRDDVSLLPRSMIACGRWWTKVIAASIFSGAATAKRTGRSRARRSSSEVHSRRIGDRDQDRAVGELADGQRGEAAGELLAQEHGRLGLTSDHVELDKGSSDSSARRRASWVGPRNPRSTSSSPSRLPEMLCSPEKRCLTRTASRSLLLTSSSRMRSAPRAGHDWRVFLHTTRLSGGTGLTYAAR